MAISEVMAESARPVEVARKGDPGYRRPAAIPAEATTLRTKLMSASLDAWGSARDPYMPSFAVETITLEL